MISVVLYGRNDAHGYNLHKRAAISLNAIAEVLSDPDDEIIFVDYNTPDDLPTFPEAIADTLTASSLGRLRVLRVRPEQHQPFAAKTHLVALEPVARNVALRRSNPANRWVLSTNTDMIFVTTGGEALSHICGALPDGFYHLPRFELPESLWEGFDRRNPQGVIEQTRTWASRLHLEEVVRGSDNILFDGPGDFQLALRDDLHRIDGFHEEMILGWHVDANLSRRMRLLRGRILSLDKSVKAYHCDHTRQTTAIHGHDRAQNDPVRFVDSVREAGIPEQSASWGLADQEIEEIDLTKGASARWLRALEHALPPAPKRPYESRYIGATYDDLAYAPAHVVPYVLDLLVAARPNAVIGYVGARSDTHALIKACTESLGIGLSILVPPGFDWLESKAAASNEEWRSRADLFVVEFGVEPGVNQADERLGAVMRRLDGLVHASPPDRPVKAIAVNAIHNRFERFVTAALNPTATPFSTRVRHGYIGAGRGVSRTIPSARAIAEWLTFSSGRALLTPTHEVAELMGDLRSLIDEPGEKPTLWWQARRAAGDLIALTQMPGLAAALGRSDDELAAVRARLQRSRPSAGAGGATDPLPLVEGALTEGSRLANIQDWEEAGFRRWVDRFLGGEATYPMNERSPHTWQRIAILQALESSLSVGATADLDVDVVLVGAEDEPLVGMLRQLGARVSVSAPSMEYLPERTDALVFVGQSLLADGLDAAASKLAKADRCLAQSGVLLFVAAARLDDGVDDRSLARELMLDGRLSELFERVLGYSPLSGERLAVSPLTLDRMSRAELGPGVFVQSRGDALTTLSLWSWRKAAAAKWDVGQAATLLKRKPLEGEVSLLRNYSPLEVGASTSLLERMDRHASVEATVTGLRMASATRRGHVLWGPYLTLQAGTYRCLADVKRTRTRMPGLPLLALEAVLGRGVTVRRLVHGKDLNDGALELSFAVEPAQVGQEFEFRVTFFGRAELMFNSIRLQRLS